MSAPAGYGELHLFCDFCDAPVAVCGYIDDLEPARGYRCLTCREALQDERDSRPKQSAAVPYNEFPEGY